MHLGAFLIGVILLTLTLITFISPQWFYGKSIKDEANKAKLGGLYFGSLIGFILGVMAVIAGLGAK